MAIRVDIRLRGHATGRFKDSGRDAKNRPEEAMAGAKLSDIIMKLDQKVLNRIDELIQMGDRLLGTRRDLGPHIVGDDRVDSELAHQWATSVQNLLSKVFGQDSEYYKNFTTQVNKVLTFSPARRCLGILKAAKDDYANSHVYDLRRLIEAEVFDDFLSQASYLLDTGYHAPAAVIAGCVLEDGLRKQCDKENIPLSPHPKLDAMNAELAKKGTYSLLVQKRITMLADLRNKAAHGRWSEFTEEDVKEMIEAVRRIMEEYFS